MKFVAGDSASQGSHLSPAAAAPATTLSHQASRGQVKKSRFHFSDQSLAPLLLAPAMTLIMIFVYVFIAVTVWVSLSRWGTLRVNLDLREPFGATYAQMFSMPRWHANLRNVVVFTTLFLSLSISMGLLLALCLDRRLIGHTLFRNVFLFPYALSFIVTGIVWRWIFNPETGINILLDVLGINKLMVAMGGPALHPGWTTDPSVIFSLNSWLGAIFPAVKGLSIQLGIPVAMIPVVIAAAWQLTGFAMSMYIAGLAAIPHDLREAARIDGASEIQTYTKVIIPLLRPVTVSTAIILGHVSLKIFDLIFAMTGVGPGFATDVPGIFVFDQTFKATRYNLGAAASVIMLLLVSIIIVPYLWSSLRKR
ncbi:MAG: sugar ABC transporter permease [Verrucomicrobia bacterium]|nr:sugar ABC transporter permease [Verrucomicrobiota bacterium]